MSSESGRQAVESWELLTDGADPPPGVEIQVLGEHRSRKSILLRHGARALFCKQIVTRDILDRVRESFRLGELLGRTGPIVETERALRLHESLNHGPRLLALGERVSRGLVREQILLFEALLEHRGMIELLEAADTTEEKLELVYRAHELVEELDGVGLAHLDFHAGNVMLSTVSPAFDCVVDLSQLREVRKHRAIVLAFVLGHFYEHGMGRFLSSEDYLRAAESRLRQLAGDTGDLEETTRAMRYFAEHPLKRRRRHGLASVGLAGMPRVVASIAAWSALPEVTPAASHR